ncbi:hypothetical protein PAGU2638_14880 [Lysobacter sp. PAGU 2638]
MPPSTRVSCIDTSSNPGDDAPTSVTVALQRLSMTKKPAPMGIIGVMRIHASRTTGLHAAGFTAATDVVNGRASSATSANGTDRVMRAL